MDEETNSGIDAAFRQIRQDKHEAQTLIMEQGYALMRLLSRVEWLEHKIDCTDLNCPKCEKR